MIVSKDKQLKKKALDNGYDNKNRLCIICRKKITAEDVENNNFEYTKNKSRENYAHSSCVKYR